MRPTRCTRAIGAAVLVLLVFSLVFDDAAAYLPAAALAFFLVYRGILFDRSLRTVVGSLTVSRTASRMILRQGSTVDVTARVAYHLPDHTTLTLRDRPPAGAILAGGDLSHTATEPGAGSADVAYRMKVMTRGEIAFGGVGVTLADRFFAADIDLAGDGRTAPHLIVHPAGAFEKEAGSGSYGEAEHRTRSAVSGYTIHSFREYAMGDDPRRIDWKLSAKHQKLFVKEYTGQQGDLPLIIVDMPERTLDAGGAEVGRIVSAASGALEEAIGEYRSVSLLVISGGNIIRFLESERDIHRVMAAAGAMEPTERLVHFYYARDKVGIRAKRSRVERDRGIAAEESPERRFCANLAEIYRSVQEEQTQTAFELQVGRAMASTNAGTVYIFSRFSGDCSHIWQIVTQARRTQKDVHLRVPEETASPGMLRSLLHAGVASVEVI
ncbi:DUF58 domain-containing protein [Methanoculleus sp. FWC-SCC1]|uniref:DUF58 domain-containing protein n=1 Tax=Methanoculleus frigidifontis TaxID=2584085 RepID=A0ABT8M8P8_9EURY|nr:DUF58 domain-containing protein [Methanoculleus sp. FWC-SCC1]MDN7024311.1 DUF58 domain-containing protein [Methanoculleus sp. FWC-SCC1]